jgi:hypothetical protein
MIAAFAISMRVYGEKPYKSKTGNMLAFLIS